MLNGAKLTSSGVHGRWHALLAVHHGRNPNAVLCPRHQVCQWVERTQRCMRAAPGWVVLGCELPSPWLRAPLGGPTVCPRDDQPSCSSAAPPGVVAELSIF